MMRLSRKGRRSPSISASPAWVAAAVFASACGARSLLPTPSDTSSSADGAGGATATTTSTTSTTSTTATSTTSTTGTGGGGPVTLCGDLKIVWSTPLANALGGTMDVDPQGIIYVSNDGDINQIGPNGAVLGHYPVDIWAGTPISASGGRLLGGDSKYFAYMAPPGNVPIPLWKLNAATLGFSSVNTRGVVTGGGRFIVAGYAAPALELIAFDDTGSVLWKGVEDPAQNFLWTVARDAQDGVVMFVRDPPRLIRRAGDGKVISSVSYDPITASVADIAVAPSGDLYLLGVTDYPVAPTFSVGHVSAGGQQLWKTVFQSDPDESLSCGIAPLSDGSVVVCVGYEHGLTGMQRLSPQGVPLWAPQDWFSPPPCPEVDPPQSIHGSPDGTVVILTADRVVKLAP